EQLHEPTRQLDAYKRVVNRDPKSEPGILGMAAAQRSLGQLDAARRQYEQLTQLPQNPALHLVELARLRMEQVLLSGATDWKDIEDIIQRAEAVEPDKVDVVLVRAQFLAAQNKADEACALLEKAHARSPKQAAFWSALAELEEREKHWDKAQALLDQ